MRAGLSRYTIVAGSVLVLILSGFVYGFEWEVYDDVLSNSTCDVVNAANTELVVRADTGQLVIIRGPDTTLLDTFVDLDFTVCLETGIPGLMEPVGFIDFAEDGDGYRTLWWMTLTGLVIGVDDFTAEPYDTDLFPSDFVDVPCDACPYIDDPFACDGMDDVVNGPIVFNLCGLNAQLGLALTAVGLGFTKLSRRRAT